MFFTLPGLCYNNDTIGSDDFWLHGIDHEEVLKLKRKSSAWVFYRPGFFIYVPVSSAMTPDASPLKTTPLTDAHRQLSAQMGPFAGWDMPIRYEGILAEAQQARRSACCFDICHMGEFTVEGKEALPGLERCITSRLATLAVGGCRYGSILNENGGVIDDLIVYRRSETAWMIVVNAATLDKDKEFFSGRLPASVRFRDVSARLGKIDLQGPRSREVLTGLLPEAAELEYYTFKETRLLGDEVIVSRTGYTGELGFELYLPSKKIPELWQQLVSDPRVRPAGLGARDVLRLEMGYSLYGQDIDETTTPLEAGLEAFCDLTKEFAGQPALLRQKKEGVSRRRVFLLSRSRRAPRHGHKIFHENKEIGTITSGTFSPHAGAGIGMGFADVTLETGQTVLLGEDGRLFEAVLTTRPFVKNTSLKN